MTTSTVASLIMPGMTAVVDLFGRNPLAEDFRSVSPHLYAQAVHHNGRPPKLFCGGALNLPPYTASGVDPIWLRELPYGVRHHAADLSTEAEVHALFERCANNPSARFDHAGLDAAITRVRAWANGSAPEISTPAPTTRIQASVRPKSTGGAGGQHLMQGLTHSQLMAMSRRGECLPRATTRRPPVTPTPTPPRSVATIRPGIVWSRPKRIAGRVAASDPDRIFKAIWPTTEGA